MLTKNMTTLHYYFYHRTKLVVWKVLENKTGRVINVEIFKVETQTVALS